MNKTIFISTPKKSRFTPLSSNSTQNRTDAQFILLAAQTYVQTMYKKNDLSSCLKVNLSFDIDFFTFGLYFLVNFSRLLAYRATPLVVTMDFIKEGDSPLRKLIYLCP
jgi:hypothetical protein